MWDYIIPMFVREDFIRPICIFRSVSVHASLVEHTLYFPYLSELTNRDVWTDCIYKVEEMK